MTDIDGAVLTRPLFAVQLTVDGFLAVGGPEGHALRLANVQGGSFEGTRLRGKVLGGGTDWQTLRVDGTVLLDARIVLQTDSGALIAVTYKGVRHGPSEVMARLGRGERVDPASYYFRIVPSFATSDPTLDWLNRIVAIGTGQRLPEGPSYLVHEVL
jgi:hypothetical protein